MSYSGYNIGVPGLTGVVRILLLVTVGVFFLQIIPGIGNLVLKLFAANPLAIVHGQVWRLLTYGFLHSTESYGHVIFNMFGLWMFGAAIEARFGAKRFLLFYLTAIVFSGTAVLLYLFQGYSPNVIGASGAIFAIMTCYAIFYPNDKIYLWGIVPIKARVLAIIFAVVSILGTLKGGGDTAHIAHLGGIVYAFLFLKIEPLVRSRLDERGIRAVKKKKETIIHYYEPRKGRQEIAAEKEEVDRVLAKISRNGMESLTEEEYRVLERASGKPVERK